MRMLKTLALSALLVWSAAAVARLPAPTPEEAAQKAAAAETKAQADEAAKQALAAAQDRVAQRYRASHPNAPVPVIAPPAPGK